MGKFLPSFYIRVHGMDIGEVGTFLGLGTGIVAGGGGVIAGRIIDRLYQRTQRPSVWLSVAAVVTLVQLPLYIASLVVPSGRVSLGLVS